MSVNIYDPSTDTLTQVPGTRNNDAAVDTMLNELGAKNLCPNNYITQVLHGLNITVKDNGEVWVSGSIESGTNSVSMQINNGLPSANEALILTGCPANGGEESYRLMVVLDNDTRYFDDGNGVIIPANSSISRVNIVIYRNNGQVYDLKFKPMIRPASIADDTYVPHAMTNRELTTVQTIVDTDGIEVKRYGRIIEIIGHGNPHVDQYVILPSDSLYRPSANIIVAGFTTSSLARVGIRPSGTLIFTTENGTPITTATNCYFQLSYTI